LERRCNSTVLVIAAVGTSGSGKTTTLEYLVSRFSDEGCRVGAIKHIHHPDFSIDREGTNTWRYAAAGSKVVAAISPHEIDIIKKTERELKDLDKIIGLLEKERLDIIFIEGFHKLIAKRTDVPKIITAKDQADLQKTLQGTAGPIIAATGVVSENAGEPKFGEIPLINVPKDGDKLVELIRTRLEQATS
jgi:molybdopterin-guanine dinucleotide biosynthesis protein MobB